VFGEDIIPAALGTAGRSISFRAGLKRVREGINIHSGSLAKERPKRVMRCWEYYSNWQVDIAFGAEKRGYGGGVFLEG